MLAHGSTSLKKSHSNYVGIGLGQMLPVQCDTFIAEFFWQVLGLWDRQPPVEKYVWLGEMDTLRDARWIQEYDQHPAVHVLGGG